MSSACISEDFVLGDVTLQRLYLNSAALKRISVGSTCPFPNGSLDLRECTFDSFGAAGDMDAQVKQFLRSQMADRFSRDPYLQLEKYYQKIGDDIRAKQIYHQGRSELRNNAKTQNTSVRWSRGKWIQDSLLKWLTGYGVKNELIFLWILFFILVNIGVFWPDDALRYKPSKSAVSESASTTPSGGAKDAASEQDAAAQKPRDLGGKFFHRFAYSLELFIPVIKLELADKWQPHPLWRQGYSLTYRIVGWILIPLLVASLSGIVKR